MLCTTCKHLVTEFYAHKKPPAWFKFSHKPIADLTRSGQDGCEICAFALKEISSESGQYTPKITGEPSRQSCIRWSGTTFEFYEPGKIAAADNSLEKHWDAKDPTAKLNVVHSQNPYEVYTPAYIENEMNLQYDLPRRSDHDSCFDLMKRWISSCQTMHPRCSRSLENPHLPTRVIDVGLDGSIPFLWETHGACGQFVTLSHRWPETLEVMTTSKNLEEQRRGVSLAESPPAFRDAVIVCQKLGFQYLWIEAICILQDSDDDWNKEAAMMGRIYANAAFTISAVTGPTKGLFCDRVQTKSKPFDSPIEEYGFPKILGFRRSHELFDMDLLGSPLDNRGWVFQERILSTATLHFGPNQLWWECRTVISPECAKPNFESLRSLTYRFGRWLWLAEEKPATRMGIWQDIVRIYSQKFFTVKTDKFAAITAVANQFGHSLFPNTDFFAGVWLQDIHHQLLWSLDRSPDVFSKDGLAKIMFARRPKLTDDDMDKYGLLGKPRSPSWSWISVDYPTRPLLSDVCVPWAEPDPDFEVIAHSPGFDTKASRENRSPISLILVCNIALCSAAGLSALLEKMNGVSDPELVGKSQKTGMEFTIDFHPIALFAPQKLTFYIDPGCKIREEMYILKIANLTGGLYNETPEGFFLIVESRTPMQDVHPKTGEAYDLASQLTALNSGVQVDSIPTYFAHLHFKRIGVGFGPLKIVDRMFAEGSKRICRII